MLTLSAANRTPVRMGAAPTVLVRTFAIVTQGGQVPNKLEMDGPTALFEWDKSAVPQTPVTL